VLPAVVFIKASVGALDGDLPYPGDGIPTVDQQVRQNLVDLCGVHPHLTDTFPGYPDQLNVLPDEPAEHLEYARNRVVQVQHLGADRLSTGRAQQGGGGQIGLQDQPLSERVQ
jgi:hypothetical protein